MRILKLTAFLLQKKTLKIPVKLPNNNVFLGSFDAKNDNARSIFFWGIFKILFSQEQDFKNPPQKKGGVPICHFPL